MPITSHVLAVDQGTTGTTAVVVGEDGLAAGTGYAGLRQHFPRPGWVEHDPEDIWQSVVTAAGAALADSGVAPTDVGALGITNQRETAVLWDRATGLPVHNAVVWQDRRTAQLCRRLAGAGISDLVRKRTGLLLDPYFSATKVSW
ncbi:MAG: FGGY family carbohydrate kinase, partial [Acidimicrobiales bacterium]